MSSASPVKEPEAWRGDVHLDTVFLRCLTDARPVGTHKHLLIVKLQQTIHHRTQIWIPLEELWARLEEMYDLDALDASTDQSDSPLPSSPLLLSPLHRPTHHPRAARGRSSPSLSPLSDASPPPRGTTSRSANLINSTHFKQAFNLPSLRFPPEKTRRGKSRAPTESVEEETPEEEEDDPERVEEEAMEMLGDEEVRWYLGEVERRGEEKGGDRDWPDLGGETEASRDVSPVKRGKAAPKAKVETEAAVEVGEEDDGEMEQESAPKKGKTRPAKTGARGRARGSIASSRRESMDTTPRATPEAKGGRGRGRGAAAKAEEAVQEAEEEDMEVDELDEDEVSAEDGEEGEDEGGEEEEEDTPKPKARSMKGKPPPPRGKSKATGKKGKAPSPSPEEEDAEDDDAGEEEGEGEEEEDGADEEEEGADEDADEEEGGADDDDDDEEEEEEVPPSKSRSKSKSKSKAAPPPRNRKSNAQETREESTPRSSPRKGRSAPSASGTTAKAKGVRPKAAATPTPSIEEITGGRGQRIKRKRDSGAGEGSGDESVKPRRNKKR